MNLRPVTLSCGTATPSVEVHQQPYPLSSDEPEKWITTVTIGEYPNRIDISIEHATPAEGIAATIDLSASLHRSSMSLLNKESV